MLTHSCGLIVIHCGNAYQFFHPAWPLNGILACSTSPVPPQTQYVILCDTLRMQGLCGPVPRLPLSLELAASHPHPPHTHMGVLWHAKVPGVRACVP